MNYMNNVDAFKRVNDPAKYVADMQQHACIKAIDKNTIKYNLNNGYVILFSNRRFDVDMVVHGEVNIYEIEKINELHHSLMKESEGSPIKNTLKNIDPFLEDNAYITMGYDSEVNKEYISGNVRLFDNDIGSEHVRVYEDGSIKKINRNMGFGNFERPKELDEFITKFINKLYHYII